jgi:hypothetical protein
MPSPDPIIVQARRSRRLALSKARVGAPEPLEIGDELVTTAGSVSAMQWFYQTSW